MKKLKKDLAKKYQTMKLPSPIHTPPSSTKKPTTIAAMRKVPSRRTENHLLILNCSNLSERAHDERKVEVISLPLARSLAHQPAAAREEREKN
jgi:hypothetical protein